MNLTLKPLVLALINIGYPPPIGGPRMELTPYGLFRPVMTFSEVDHQLHMRWAPPFPHQEA